MFFTIGQIASVIYVPALPNITQSFHCSPAVIQWSIATFMLGFAVSQFIYGPLSDCYGRKKILAVGMFLGLIGSTVCLLSTSPITLILGRFIQGCGFGVGGALAYIVLRDLFTGTELAKFCSILGMAAPLMVGVAPILGGYLQSFFGWRSIFLFLLLYGFFLWLVILFLFPETKHTAAKNKTNLPNILNNFKMLLSHKIFVGYALCNVFAYGGFMAFYTIGPFLLAQAGLSSVGTGWLVALLDGAIIVGSVINIIFVKNLGINKMIFIGLILMILAGLAALTTYVLGTINAAEVIIPAFIFALGAILIMCNAFSGALTPFPEVSGSAGGLAGGLQMLGGTLASSVAALFTTINRELLLASIYITLGILSFVALKVLIINSVGKLKSKVTY